MGGGTNRFRRFHQRGGAGEVCDGREFHRREVQAGAVQANGSGRNQHIANVNVRLNRAGGADTQEGTHAQLRQLFHGDRSRRAADAGGADDHRFAVQLRAPGGKFAVGCQLNRLIHQRGDLFHTLRIARDDSQRSPL